MQIMFVSIRLIAKRESAGSKIYFAFVSVLGLLGVCFKILKGALSPVYSQNGQIVDSGADLSSGGALEYLQDLVYLSLFALTVGSFTDWAWIVFASIPIFAGVMMWKYIIQPWLNAPSIGEMPIDEAEKKRQEKKERQAVRRQKFTR